MYDTRFQAFLSLSDNISLISHWDIWQCVTQKSISISQQIKIVDFPISYSRDRGKQRSCSVVIKGTLSPHWHVINNKKILPHLCALD